MEEGKKNANKEENEELEEEEEQVPENGADGDKEMKDRLLRLAAEFDNYKKRTAKELELAKTVGKAELVRKMLPAIDEIEIALLAIDKESKDAKGIELVLANLLSILKSEGLREIEAKGIYDPYRHEILMTKESKEKEGTILNVVRKGYYLNEIMLRPASVIISMKNKEDNVEEKSQNEE